MGNGTTKHTTEQLTHIREAIGRTFTLSELRTLAYELGIDLENFEGGKENKIQGLIEHLERRGRIPDLINKLIDLRPGQDWQTTPGQTPAPSPYKGLQYFTEADQHLFFGRESLTTTLVQRLQNERFLVVVGASGSGKSSVVRAGLVPAVRRGEIEINGHSSRDWPIHIITPTDQPLKTLAVSLTRDIESVTAATTLTADMQQDANSLDLFLLRQTADQPYQRLLLIVDQFEELFTLCHDRDQRQLFIDNLVNAVQSGTHGRLKLILTLRADFYAHAVEYESLQPLLETGQQIVRAMSREELQEAIEKPAQEEGWQFQPGLVEQILDDVGSEPGALPLLSHALQETWNRREGRMMTLNGYQQAGGVKGAIAKTADAVYANLPPHQQPLARTIFLRLTELGEGTEDTRRRVWQSELIRRPEEQETVTALIQTLANARLITTDTIQDQNGGRREVVEVSHEAIIREWPTLRTWLNENRDWLRLHRRLTQDTREWLEADRDVSLLYRGGNLAQVQEQISQHSEDLNENEKDFVLAGVKDDQRRTKVARWFTIGLVVLTITALAALVFAVLEGRRANHRAADALNAEAAAIYNEQLASTREAEAISQAQIAQSQALAASSLSVAVQHPMEALLLAIAAGKTAETALAVDVLNQKLVELAKPLIFLHKESLVVGATWHKNGMQVLSWHENGFAYIWELPSNTPIQRITQKGNIVGGKWNEKGDKFLVWSDEGIIEVRPIDNNNQHFLVLNHGERILDASWNKDERQILSWGDSENIIVWDAISGEQLLILQSNIQIVEAQWNENENLILMWDQNGYIQAWDSQLGKPVYNIGPIISIKDVVWSRDGTRLIYHQISNQEAKILDTISGETLSTITHGGFINGAKWSKDESRILSWSYDGTVKIWDSNSGQEILTLQHDAPVNGAVWNLEESLILSWSQNHVQLWNGDSGVLLATFDHEGPVLGARWSNNENVILSWGQDGTSRIWNFLNKISLITLSHDDWVVNAELNNGNSHVLSFSEDGEAWVWDANSRESLLTLDYGSQLWDATWNKNETQVLSWSEDGTVWIWNTISNNSSLLTFSHTDIVWGARWNGNEDQVISWSRDRTARVWDVFTEELLFTLDHQASVLGAQWNVDESTILSWGDDATVKIWDAELGNHLLTLNHGGSVIGASWNLDESQILTWSVNGTAWIWDVVLPNNYKLKHLLLPSHTGPVYGATWNNMEDRILTWGADGLARVWNTASGTLLLELIHEGSVYEAKWNSDEDRILTRTESGFVNVWDASSGSQLLKLKHSGPVRGAEWNEAESRILSWSDDGTVRVWDADSGTSLAIVRHELPIVGAAWNKNENQILSWSEDGTSRIWDAESGELFLTISGDGSNIMVSNWNNEENQILLGTSSGFLRIYFTRALDLALLACQYTTRNFTWEEWQLYFPGQPYEITCPQWPVHPSVPESAQ